MNRDRLDLKATRGETPPMPDSMSEDFDVRSEVKGAHWIAWVVLHGQDAPEDSVVLVGQTQEEAEARARQWAEQRLRSRAR